MDKIKKSGDWELREIVISEDDEYRQKNSMSYFKTGRYVPAGVYQQLLRAGTIVMSNTPDELDDFRYFIHKLNTLADCETKQICLLVGGLGMGCVVDAVIALNKNIHITIIEQSSDVINLSAIKYKENKDITIIEGDIFTIDFKKLPFNYYDIAWFDIWDFICAANYDDFKKLRRRYAKKADIKMFWVEKQVERLYKQDNHTNSMYQAIVDMRERSRKNDEEIRKRILE